MGRHASRGVRTGVKVRGFTARHAALFDAESGVRLSCVVMAYPGNPTKGPGFENVPPTPDDFERLAAAFRPSWELDNAPFTGAGTLSAGDIRALQAAGPAVDLRAASTQLSNGAHVPPKATATPEPVASVIIDRVMAANEAPKNEDKRVTN